MTDRLLQEIIAEITNPTSGEVRHMAVQLLALRKQLHQEEEYRVELTQTCERLRRKLEELKYSQQPQSSNSFIKKIMD